VGQWIAVLSNEEIKRERSKARELRSSQWWKRRRAAGMCHYCGRKFPPRELTMDHLVPLVRGGRSTKGNLVPACKECNTNKRQRLAFEWEPAEPSAVSRQRRG
jgi:5-methylcytosine-specific restriction protein A